MNAPTLLQPLLVIAVLLVLAFPLGRYMTSVFDGSAWAVRRLGRPLESGLYKLAGVDPDAEMSWRRYGFSLLLFSGLGTVFLYAILRLQQWLPLNPQAMAAMTPDAAFNTAVSFVTNTNWQEYGGEGTLGYFAQMVGLTVQNFLSAATGIAVAVALIRGFARHGAATIGNFWVDLTRITLYVLAPLAVGVALVLASQGVIQTFAPSREVATLQTTTYQTPKLDAAGNPLKDAQGTPVMQDGKADRQTLALGPVASQEAIKLVGTNGGGFFNANSAHPFENPTPLSNVVQVLAMLLIPAALCVVFGEMVGDRRQGKALLAAMTIAFAVGVGAELAFEQSGNPVFATLHVDQDAGALQAGGNAEGKETRFGIAQSALFTVTTTATSSGATDAAHDSLTPLGGLVPMLFMQLGEMIFGGVGSGLYSMLAFAVLAVFIAGLMIGRTPEYLGKKIEAYEMKMVAVAVLLTPFLVLIGTAIAVMSRAGAAGILNPGAHGFSEVLYAFSSAANNNGSAFAGLTVNTPFYNVLLGIAMWLGRFVWIVPVLAIAGALAGKKRLAQTAGTLPTHGPLFVTLLLGTIVLVGALTYVPALALGPVVEHLTMRATPQARDPLSPRLDKPATR
ncbi:potassium-transporting ATPase subunit KdpA [Robbsia sp. Bb-Pol-6]|uniref:Potassium-transporting ATPase potassium-binding subunit n=1 Tax=Robbsia betulipollinis TaxID=2981849 RepID=A0ABT3ZJK7_9BURK|nr:potassium-transporting ATPase subunit KdpA [Robbsia betulipollinis]MCY0386701.1 potassium-transporting ATPase subunit KdpA [Robbsia betulipollinis]